MVTFHSFFQLQEFIYQWTKVGSTDHNSILSSALGKFSICKLRGHILYWELVVLNGWPGSALKARRLSGSPSSGPFSEYVRLQNCVSCTSYTKSPSSLSFCLTAWYFKSLGRFGDWNTFFNLGATKITLVYLAFRDQTFF